MGCDVTNRLLVLYVDVVHFDSGDLLRLRHLCAYFAAVIVTLRKETAVLEQLALVTESVRFLLIAAHIQRLLIDFCLRWLAASMGLLAALVQSVVLIGKLDRVKLG